MADIAFNWPMMEFDLKSYFGTKNYLHADNIDFTSLKGRNPENIWILRKDNHKFWLLGRLTVADKKIDPVIVDIKKHWILYDPDKSEFYSNPLEVQRDWGEALNKVCKKMFGSFKNGQGANAAMSLELFDMITISKVDGNSKKISFHTFIEQLNSGEITGEPYRNVSKKVKSASTSTPPPKDINIVDLEQLVSNNLEKSSGKIEDVSNTGLNNLPDDLNKNAKRRPVSPEEDEKKRKKQAENGLEGEELARLFEIERLRDLKCPDPAAYIDHVAKKDVGLGYDILTTWEETRYIEVKTSASGSDSFFISSNEVGVLTNYNNLAWIYLVDLTKKDDIRNCIRTINNPGDKFNKEIKLVPIQYCASLMNLS